MSENLTLDNGRRGCTGSGTGLGCDRGAQMALQHTGVKSHDAPIYTLQLLAMDVTKNDCDLRLCWFNCSSHQLNRTDSRYHEGSDGNLSLISDHE